MLLKWQYNLLVALGALAVLVVVVNGVLFTQNRTLQSALDRRQRFVQQTVPLESLYNEIARTLAQLGVKSNDRDVLDMLAAQGLTVTVNGPSTAPADSATHSGVK